MSDGSASRPPPPATNSIIAFLHCRRCGHEVPRGMSMREYARYEVGWTSQGFQLWCLRHECNVLHVDFQGQKHPANLSALVKPTPPSDLAGLRPVVWCFEFGKAYDGWTDDTRWNGWLNVWITPELRDEIAEEAARNQDMEIEQHAEWKGLPVDHRGLVSLAGGYTIQEAPLYAATFRDFAVGDMPECPDGFTDQSWRNDACPVMRSELLRLEVWCDHPDPMLREMGEDTARFIVAPFHPERGDLGKSISLNEWDNVLKVIEYTRWIVRLGLAFHFDTPGRSLVYPQLNNQRMLTDAEADALDDAGLAFVQITDSIDPERAIGDPYEWALLVWEAHGLIEPKPEKSGGGGA